MKKILSLFLIVFYSVTLPQETVTALITEPQIGSENGELFLQSIVTDINNRKNIESAVVLGNLTASGGNDEFILAQSILNKLNVSYNIIGGPRDIVLSEGRGTGIHQFWPQREMIAHTAFSNRIFLEPITMRKSKLAHLSIETINYLSTFVSKKKSILFFSYFPLDEKIDNWFELSNLFQQKKIISFNSLSVERKKSKSFIKKFSGNALANSKEWQYNIIIESVDSLRIYNVSEKKSKMTLIEDLSKTELNTAEQTDSLQLLSYQFGLKISNETTLNSSTYSSILSSNGRNYISTADGRIICRDRYDMILWEYNTGGAVHNSILIDRDLLVVITNDGDLYTINANNGDLVQIIGISEPISSDINLIDLEYNGLQTKGIVFCTAYGNVYCYELYSLELVWENYFPEENIVSAPVLINKRIIFQSRDEYFYCVNDKNGILIWKWKSNIKAYNIFFHSDVVSDGKTVFSADSDGDLHAVDLLLGTKKWEKKKLSASGKIFYCRNRRQLIAHSKKNEILILNQSNGKVKKKIKLADEFKNSFPVCWNESDRNVYLGFDNGIICAINKKNEINKILFTGNSPIISLVKIDENEFITNNLDGKIIQFEFQ
jgi:outer membrane protein assembly factor BamB